MDGFFSAAGIFVQQLQQPTLAFLLGGMLLAALGSRLEIPQPVFRVIVFLLLMKVGLNAGMAVRDANLLALMVPALAAALIGITIVLLGWVLLARRRHVSTVDATATAGVFGAVSASTLAAGMANLDASDVAYEGFIGALYPFMDISAILVAILIGRTALNRSVRANATPNDHPSHPAKQPPGFTAVAMTREILSDAVRSPALSALLLGILLGTLTQPDALYDGFYAPLFAGLLSILMLVMGMEAWARLTEMKNVAHIYILYGITAPFVHGFLGLAAGLVVHHLTGFSAGGVALLAVMAASSSDISAPPTLRAVLPEANPSAYVGTSTGLGTPVAILTIPLWIALANLVVAS